MGPLLLVLLLLLLRGAEGVESVLPTVRHLPEMLDSVTGADGEGKSTGEGMGSIEQITEPPEVLGSVTAADGEGKSAGKRIEQIPGLDPIATMLPPVRHLPEALGSVTPADGEGKSASKGIEQITEPLAKLINAPQGIPTEVNQLMRILPNLVVNLPGAGPLDVNKLPPWMVEHVLNGGQLPGVTTDMLKTFIRQHMLAVYAAAAQELGRPLTKGVPPLDPKVDTKLYLRPVTELPHRFVTSVLQGHSLPHLTEEQTQVIKDYYVREMPSLKDVLDDAGSVDVRQLLTPKVLAMIKLMPPGFEYKQLPPEVFKMVMNGEVPDMSLLPPHLQDYLKKNLDHVFNALNETPELSIDEILAKLPTFDSPQLPSYSPYDINSVDAGLVIKSREESEGKDLDQAALHHYSIFLLAIAMLLSASCIVIALYRLHRAQVRWEEKQQRAMDC